MKNVGIIRRVDALGRIVIPREYRKLNRIEIGDPLEIVANDDGGIVLKKVDLTAELMQYGQRATDIAASLLDCTALVCTGEKYVCGSGAGKNGFVGEPAGKAVANAIESRKCSTCSSAEAGLGDSKNAVICPINGDLDCFGAFVLLTEQSDSEAQKVASALAAMIGRTMQKY